LSRHLFSTSFGQLLGFATACAVPAFDLAGDVFLALFGFPLGAFGLPSGIFLTLLANLASFARRYIALRRGRDQWQAGENQSNWQQADQLHESCPTAYHRCAPPFAPGVYTEGMDRTIA
jgi:hypothetical protein